MTLHREIHLEDEICADLAAAGWLYDVADASRYDRTQALYLDDVVAWIKTSQPKAWEAIDKSHGTAAPKEIAERLRKALDAQGVVSTKISVRADERLIACSRAATATATINSIAGCSCRPSRKAPHLRAACT